MALIVKRFLAIKVAIDNNIVTVTDLRHRHDVHQMAIAGTDSAAR